MLVSGFSVQVNDVWLLHQLVLDFMVLLHVTEKVWRRFNIHLKAQCVKYFSTIRWNDFGPQPPDYPPTVSRAYSVPNGHVGLTP